MADEPTLVERLEKLKEIVEQAKDAADGVDEYVELMEKLDDLDERIDAAASDPESLDGGTYADLALEMMTLIPNELPLPEPAKKAIEGVAAGVGAFIKGSTDLALTLAARKFREQLQAFPPEEAAKMAATDPATIQWLLIQHKLGKVTLKGDTREVESTGSWFWRKLTGWIPFLSPVWIGGILLVVVVAILLGPVGILSSDDDDPSADETGSVGVAVPGDSSAEPTSAASPTGGTVVATAEVPVGDGCAGVGTEVYTMVPARDQFVPGATPINELFSFAAVDGALNFCIELPAEVDPDAAIDSGGYLLSTLSLTLNDLLIELTVSEGDGVAPFGRVIQRAGAIEQSRFPYAGAQVLDGAVLFSVPAQRDGGALTFTLGGMTYSELSFLGVGIGTFQDQVNSLWLGTAAGDVAAFDAAVSWP